MVNGTRSAPAARKNARSKKPRKPPPRWRKYLVQAELELPPPAEGGDVSNHGLEEGTDDANDAAEWRIPAPLPWWQERPVVLGLAALCVGLLVLAGLSLRSAWHDRAAARAADARVKVLTLRAIDSERALRIAPNPRSWSAAVDAQLAWPEPPQLLELYLPVGYAADYRTFALVIDKVDHGRVMVVERMTPDSNQDLRLGVNSSAFGPGEYRMRIQGYTWRGERVDVGWVRLRVDAPSAPRR
jgi:hypothetical protein